MVDVRLDQQVAVVAACNQGGTEPAMHEAIAVLEAVPEPALGIVVAILCVGASVRWSRAPRTA
jgi:hypothetical protein